MILSRFLEINKVLSEHLLLYKCNKHRKKPLGRRIREACERLGPTFIKAGQLLSTRYDFFSREDCEELQKLLDKIAPLKYDIIREIFKYDFGKYPEDVFKRFNKKPLASASVAQVHVAYLTTGEKVAVKIRKPHIGKKIETDLKLLKLLASVAPLLIPKLRYLGTREIANDCEHFLLKELDFRNEAQNMITMKKYLEDAKNGNIKMRIGRVIVPRPYLNLCSYHVLTMEFMEGIPMHRYKEAKKDYDPLRSMNSIFSIGARSFSLKQNYYFHGDPHPANLLVGKNGDVVLLDLGVIGTFNPDLAHKSQNFLLFTYLKDVEALINWISELTSASKKQVARMRPDIKKFIDKSAHESLGFWFIGMLSLFLKHKVNVPREFALFGRTMALFDGIVQMIDKDAKTIDLIGPDLRDVMLERIINTIKETDVMPVIYTLSEKIKKTPQKLNAFIDEYYDNPLKLIKDLRAEI